MNADNPSAALGKEQARVLTEALPYLHAYHGKTFVIDYARRSSGRPAAWNSLGRDLALLSLVGLRLVVVHRGDVLNAELVSLINRHERRAAGLSGVDGGFLQARRALDGTARFAPRNRASRSHAPAHALCEGFPACRSPAGNDSRRPGLSDGRRPGGGCHRSPAESSEADRHAGSAGLSDDSGRLVHRLSAAQAEALNAGNVHLARALRSGVSAVHVVDARRPDLLLLEILTSESPGTLILPDGITGVIEQSAQYLAPWNKGDERESC